MAELEKMTITGDAIDRLNSLVTNLRNSVRDLARQRAVEAHRSVIELPDIDAATAEAFDEVYAAMRQEQKPSAVRE